MCVFFFKQKTAYEMRISDWSSDVCSSDLYHGICELLSTLKTAVGTSEVTISSDATFAEIDRSATRAGEVYRGVGVAVGVLGVAILFCALSPLMFVLSHHAAGVIAVIKVALMVAVVSMLLYGIHRSEERRGGKEGVSTCRSRWLR